MLILIPILLLLVFAIGLNLLGRYKLAIGSTWLFTAGAVLLVWVLYIISRIKLPEGLKIFNWSPLGIGSDPLLFSLSKQTWIFAFLLVSLLVGVIFTDTVRLGRGDYLTTWTGSMVLTAVGLLSVYSQTLLAVIITWTIIDIVEFVILVRVIQHPRVHQAAVLEFITRILGTSMIIAALVFSDFHGVISENIQFSKEVYILILLGSTLRLGVLPLHVPLTANLPLRRSLGTILRFVAPLTVFSFLVQIQPQLHLQITKFDRFLFPIALITALYGAVKWATAQNELTGRSFWMLAFSGLVLMAVLEGKTESIIAYSLIMIICGGFVFFHSYSIKWSVVMGVICSISLLGIPYTPAAPLWLVLRQSNGFVNILLVITLSLLFVGFAKFVVRKRESNSQVELWMVLFYTIGLFLLILVPWLTLIWRFSEIKEAQVWAVPVMCLVFIWLSFVATRFKIGQKLLSLPAITKIKPIYERVGKLMGRFFEFEWFVGFLRGFLGFLSYPLHFFSRILEGDGGLLWSLLFLALISSVIIKGVQP